MVGSCHCHVIGLGKLKPPTSITAASLVALLKGHDGTARDPSADEAPLAPEAADGPAPDGDAAAGDFGTACAGGLGCASLQAIVERDTSSEAWRAIRRAFMLLG